MTQQQADNLVNLAYSFIISGDTDDERMTVEMAAYTINEWRKEGNELADIEGLTPENFAAAWNEVYDYFHNR